jgi:hypothetical protein
LTATECNSGYRTENGDPRAIFNPHGSAGHLREWDKRPSNVRISAEVVAGVQSSEKRHAGRFPPALDETGTGGGNAGCRIHLVRAHCG